MATTTVSIGSNQDMGDSVDNSAVVPSSCGGSGPWTVAFTVTPSSNVAVGDIYVAQDESSSFATFTFLLTGISGSDYTLKYLSCDDGGMGSCGSTSPCDIYDMSFGTVGGKFKRAHSTITLFEQMVDDASPMYWGSTDDVVGECHGDSDFTDSMVYFTTKQSLASVTLTVYETDKHDGSASGPLSGKVLIRPTAGSGHNNGIIDVNIDNFIMEWIEIDLGALDSTNTNKAVLLRGTNDDNIIRNNLIHDKGGNPGNTGPYAIHQVGAGATSDNLYIFNNIIYSFIETLSDTTGGIVAAIWQGGLYVYNNTIYKLTSEGSKFAQGIRFGNDTDNVSYIKNNIVAGLSNGERAYWKQASGSTANIANNLSDDTTGATYNAKDMAQSLNDTSALIGKTLAEIDFISIGVGTEDLRLNTDSVCREAGVDLGTTNEVNIAINGVDRDATGVTWDIGADQASVLGGSAGTAFIMFLDT